MSEYKRNCPDCDIELEYKRKHHLKDAIKNNRKCHSCANSGKNNPFYGKSHSEKSNEKRSKSIQKYFEDNPEAIEKIRDAVSGTKRSDETKQLLSGIATEWHRHNENPMKGKSHSKSTREYISKLNKEYWDEYRKTGEYKEWESKKEERHLYYLNVRRITRHQKLETFENYKKSGYEIDHKYPIIEGFNNNIPPEVIGDITNLRIISRRENRRKQDKVIESLIPKRIQRIIENE